MITVSIFTQTAICNANDILTCPVEPNDYTDKGLSYTDPDNALKQRITGLDDSLYVH